MDDYEIVIIFSFILHVHVKKLIMSTDIRNFFNRPKKSEDQPQKEADEQTQGADSDNTSMKDVGK